MKRTSALVLTALVIAALFAVLAPLTVLAEFGTNWTATYYNCTDFNCPAVTSQTGINGINFVWGTGSPITGVNVDNFTIRYESIQQFQAGTYEFVASSDDGIRVYIDGALVLDRFIGRTFTTDRFQQTLTAGPHALRVEYLELIDQAQVQFQYFLISASPGVPTGTAGFDAFGTPIPIGTPVPAQGATVSFVRGLAVRTGPYLGATFVTTALAGTTYQVLARNSSEGVYTWYRIKVGEREGWASGRYLSFTGIDPNALPEQGSIFDEIDGAPDLGVIGAPRSIMNLRARPSERSARLGLVEWGEEVSIIGRTLQARQNRWFQVRTADGTVGWIFAPFVAVRGDINRVPVR
jgi:uncharacterized protein YraI